MNKRIWLPIGIVILGLIFGYQILGSNTVKSESSERKQNKRVRIVQVSDLVKGSVEPNWLASGYVSASETVKVHAKVSGDIADVNNQATPGRFLDKEQWLVKLDPVDFELSLKSQIAQLNQANASLSLEQADQVLAKEELELLGESSGLKIDKGLVLRKPQLAAAQAKVEVAKNNLEKAKLNLSRTVVKMPFKGMVLTKNVGRGSKVSSNTALFSVTNTQTYWIEVKVPHSFLPLLNKAETYNVMNNRVWGDGNYRKAHFLSVLPDLDNKDRQVKLLLAIDDPLLYKQETSELPQVFINDFVNVQLIGQAIQNAWTIKHHWLQSDNTIWVVDAKNTLQKRKVRVLFKGRDLIYVDGDFKPGDLALAEKPGIANIGLPVTAKGINSPKNNFQSRASNKNNTHEKKRKNAGKKRAQKQGER